MNPITGIDGSFLHMEHEALPMHTVKVLVFAGPAPSADEVARAAETALERLPILRQVVMAAPVGLAQPLLVDDERFDLMNHVNFQDLPAPGSQGDLDDLVGAFAERPLPRNRPLWEVVVVRGLDAGRWAAIVKLHHSLADGGASVAMLSRALAGPDGPHEHSPKPSLATRLAFEIGAFWDDAVSAPELFRRSLRKLAAIHSKHEADPFDHDVSTGPFRGPKLRMNDEVSYSRQFASTKLPLALLDSIRKQRGVSLNDLLLAVLSGALRAYLLSRSELPKEPLVASVPVSLSHEEHIAGNDLTSVFAALPVHEREPLERLRFAHDSMAAAKADLALDPELGRDWTNHAPPFALRAVLGVGNLIGAIKDRPPVNLIVSNVRGPARQLRAGSHALEAIYSVGPLVDHVGLNITAWSYNGELFVGLLASSTVPDLDVLVELIPVALEELALATGRRLPEAA